MSKRAASPEPLDDQPLSKKARNSSEECDIYTVVDDCMGVILNHLDLLSRVLFSLTCSQYYNKYKTTDLRGAVLVTACADSGRVSLCAWAMNIPHIPIDFKLCLAAAIESGNNQVVYYIMAIRKTNPYRMILTRAAAAARPRSLKLFPLGRRHVAYESIKTYDVFLNHEQRAFPPIAMAALYNNQAIGERLFNDGLCSRWIEKAGCNHAAIGNSPDFLAWVIKNRASLMSERVVIDIAMCAIIGDSLPCLELLKSLDRPYSEVFPSYLACEAARRGRRRILEFLLGIDCVSMLTIEAAIEGGNIEILDFLLQWKEGHTVGGSVIRMHVGLMFVAAAKSGHVPMLERVERLAKEKGAELYGTPPEPTREAAANGHFDALRWLRDRGFRWDAYAAYHAVARPFRVDRSGGSVWNGRERLKMLRWMIEEGCPIDTSVIAEVLFIDRSFATWLASKVSKEQKIDRTFYLVLSKDNIAYWHFGMDHGFIPPTASRTRVLLHHYDEEIEFDEEDEDGAAKVELLRQYWYKGRSEYGLSRHQKRLEIRADGKILLVKGH